MGPIAGYEKTLEAADRFQGMMAPLSIATFQAFLNFQKEQGIVGDMFEYGVFYGRSASVLLNSVNEGETVHLIDVHDYPELDKLSEISPSHRFVKGKSEELFEQPEFMATVPEAVRFSHHDASHTFDNVTTEMGAMVDHIGPGGLMVLDDFGNPAFFQVVSACFTFLALNDVPIEVLLFSANKCYLCRSEDFDMYAKFVVKDLLPSINQTSQFNCYLARTDISDRYRGFSMFPKNTPEDLTYYGSKTYGERFYQV